MPRHHRFAALALCALALVVSCRRAADTPAPYVPPPAADEFTVMSYNLRMFRYLDRDEDGQEDDFKPEEEIVPLLEIIRHASPDILAIQELGDAGSMETLRERLRSVGADYPYHDHVVGDGNHVSLGLLSRFPIVAREPITNLTYTIQDQTFPVLRGFQTVDLETSGGLRIRVVNVHLKSKMFHEAGQTEMRRNEARLLATQLRRMAKADPALHLVVCGDFNDGYNSAAMRELLNQENLAIEDLRLTDPQGDRWTHYFRRDQTYARIDYILVNPAMKQRWVEEKSGIVRDPRTYAASDHRPVIATFKATKD